MKENIITLISLNLLLILLSLINMVKDVIFDFVDMKTYLLLTGELLLYVNLSLMFFGLLKKILNKKI